MKINKIIIKTLLTITLIIFIIVSLINIIVLAKSSKYIYDSTNYNNYDYILVLGAKVSNETPSLMLKDRLNKAIEVYNQNKNIKIIISGDSQNPNKYDEVSVMYNYLIDKNIEESNIIKDNYGISTYDSFYRTKDMLKNKKTIVITQKYHLYRSIFIARELDIDSIGIYANEYKYFGQFGRDLREILARVKDYVFTKLKIKSKYN